MAAKRDVELVRPYLPAFHEGSLRHALRNGRRPFDVALLAAITLRETWAGTCPGYVPKGPDGRGDGGHGRGLFQLDDRGPWAGRVRPAPWDVSDQASAACEVLEDAQRALALWRDHPLYVNAVLARYNARLERVVEALKAGQHPDTVTTGKDYSKDVLATRAWLRATNPTLFPLPAAGAEAL